MMYAERGPGTPAHNLREDVRMGNMPFMPAPRFARGETLRPRCCRSVSASEGREVLFARLSELWAPSQFYYSMDRAHTTDIGAPSPVPCSVAYHQLSTFMPQGRFHYSCRTPTSVIQCAQRTRAVDVHSHTLPNEWIWHVHDRPGSR